jgi:hypothetical protein
MRRHLTSWEKSRWRAHADASVYDPSATLFYVGNGDKCAHEDYCLLSIIDTTSGDKVGDIKIDVDHIEAMAIEKSGPRLFVNLTSTSAVGVIDRGKRTVIATWPNADEGRANGPMAFDEANHRLLAASRDPNKLIVIDTDSGKVVASLPTTGQFISDHAVYDPATKRIYVAGTPFLNLFQQRSSNGYQLLDRFQPHITRTLGFWLPNSSTITSRSITTAIPTRWLRSTKSFRRGSCLVTAGARVAFSANCRSLSPGRKCPLGNQRSRSPGRVRNDLRIHIVDANSGHLI